jgi:hypothetical protein
MEGKMSKMNIDKMVDRFLNWRLPNDFAPDCGISFNPAPDAMGYEPTWPVGTNLLTAVQAKQMLSEVVQPDEESGYNWQIPGTEAPEGELLVLVKTNKGVDKALVFVDEDGRTLRELEYGDVWTSWEWQDVTLYLLLEDILP